MRRVRKTCDVRVRIARVDDVTPCGETEEYITIDLEWIVSLKPHFNELVTDESRSGRVVGVDTDAAG